MTAFFLIGREADVSIGPNNDYNKTSLSPNGGSEGYGENEGVLPFGVGFNDPVNFTAEGISVR